MDTVTCIRCGSICIINDDKTYTCVDCKKLMPAG